MSVVLTIDEIANKLNPILSDNGIEKAVLFGSYVRNETTPESDIGLVIDRDITGFPYATLLIEMEERLGKNIDLIPRRCIDRSSKIYKNIENEGVIIDEAI